MIHRVCHVVRCAYDAPAEQAALVLRLSPRPLPCQRVHAAALRVGPAGARMRDGRDHFGNAVTWVFLDHGHAGFEVASEATVEVLAHPAPAPFSTPAWEAVARAGPDARDAAEFAFGSPLAPASDAARAYAAPSFPPGFPVLGGLLDLMGRIGRDVRFRPGAAPAGWDRALRLGAGPGQDLAHLMIAGLRGLGLPARCVSGSVRSGGGRLHAWVEGWLGPRHGWLGLDPAHDRVPDDCYVVLGWGRDAADVTPLRSAVTGGGGHALGMAVQFDPEACGLSAAAR